MGLEETMASVVGEAAGKWMVSKFGGGVEGLKSSLEYLYSWERDFSITVEGDTITSQGLCPVKRYYPAFCERGCLEFIRRVASAFNAVVERLSTDPVCKFKFAVRK